MRLALVSLVLVALAPAARADLILEAYDDHYTTVGSGPDGERNPQLGAAAGERVTVELRNLGERAHDFGVRGAGDGAIGCCVAPGGTGRVTWTIPLAAAADEGDRVYEYACSVHGEQGMRGKFVVWKPLPGGGPAPEPPGSASPTRAVDAAWPLALAALSFAALARQRR